LRERNFKNATLAPLGQSDITNSGAEVLPLAFVRSKEVVHTAAGLVPGNTA